ncbi:MAG: GmrSD restriction endonuclease domain-containing protein, partial [Burkholderiales bacterium]
SVEELVGMIERGELRLPEMQRQYVWRSTRVRDLLDSLYRGYPSGAILLWETDEDVPLQAMAVGQQSNPYKTTRLLLDGQQRLTSLSAVIRGEPVNVRGRKRPIEILFNLEHPNELQGYIEINEESDVDDTEPDQEDASEDELQQRFDQMTFVVSTRKLESSSRWVKVSEVFKSTSNTEFLKQAGVTSFDDPRADLYGQRLDRLRAVKKYVYRMDVLERTLSYDEVTEIFVRVNSLGAKLRSSDLALAQITAKWKNSLHTFQAFQGKCKEVGFDLELGIHLKNMVAMATGQSRFKTVSSLDITRLQTAWNDACEGMSFAMNFLKNNVGIDSPALLSSPFMVVAISYFGHKRNYQISPDESKLLRYWVLAANAKGRFSRGSSETLLDQDIASIRDGGDIQDLIDRLRSQVGRLEISPEELSGRNQRSALFKTMFLAFRSAGAKDWHSNLTIALDHSGVQHRLQFHHIFPKAVLTKAGVISREADDIANLAFIGGKTNRVISDKTPKEYLAFLASKRYRLIQSCLTPPPTRSSLKYVANESRTGLTYSFQADTQNALNNEISFSLVQSLFCLHPQIHGSEPSPKKS